MEEKKKYIVPVAEIVEFQEDDVIATSNGFWGGNVGEGGTGNVP